MSDILNDDIRVRVNEDFKLTLETEAKALGLKLAPYIRMILTKRSK